MIRYLAVWYVLFSVLAAEILPADITPPRIKDHYMGIRILDQKILDLKSLKGMKFAEISDLAYDKKHKVLYMVSDKGILYSFQCHFSHDKIILQALQAGYLRDTHGKRLKKWKRDSEGMCLDAKGNLLISFEGDVKIAWFHKAGNKFGWMIHQFHLPKELQNIKHYRSKNKALEALAWHPKYGVVTSPEWPLKRYHKKRHTIYSLNGRRWFFRAEKEARSSVTAMVPADDGNMIVVERSFTGIFNPFVVTLKKVYLSGGDEKCKSKVLAKFNTHEGWDIDNFEGLCKVSPHRYMMISDNGDNFYQKTLLIYFEVL